MLQKTITLLGKSKHYMAIRSDMKMKYLFCILFFLSSHIYAFDHSTGLKASKAGGGYVMAANHLHLISNSHCGYALNNNPNIIKATKEVLDSFPLVISNKLSKSFQSQEFLSMARLEQIGGIDAALNELTSKGYDKKTACGKLAAAFEINYQKAKQNWQFHKKQLQK